MQKTYIGFLLSHPINNDIKDTYTVSISHTRVHWISNIDIHIRNKSNIPLMWYCMPFHSSNYWYYWIPSFEKYWNIFLRNVKWSIFMEVIIFVIWTFPTKMDLFVYCTFVQIKVFWHIILWQEIAHAKTIIVFV